MRTSAGCQAMVHTLVTGTRLSGGLTPERADTLLTVMLEHPYFSGLDEMTLREMLEQSCNMPPQPIVDQRVRLDDPHLTFLLLSIVVRSDEAPPRSTLLTFADQIGLSSAEAEAILAADLPPELDILNVEEAPEEVYLDVLIAAAAADGRLAPEELDKLVSFACSRLELRLLPRQEIEDVMAASLQGFLDHGVTSWLETLPLALPDAAQRRVAYQLAEEMIAADLEITSEETRFMQDLAAVLELTP